MKKDARNRVDQISSSLFSCASHLPQPDNSNTIFEFGTSNRRNCISSNCTSTLERNFSQISNRSGLHDVVRARVVWHKFRAGNSKVGAFATDYEKIFVLLARLSW